MSNTKERLHTSTRKKGGLIGCETPFVKKD